MSFIYLAQLEHLWKYFIKDIIKDIYNVLYMAQLSA